MPQTILQAKSYIFKQISHILNMLLLKINKDGLAVNQPTWAACIADYFWSSKKIFDEI